MTAEVALDVALITEIVCNFNYISNTVNKYIFRGNTKAEYNHGGLYVYGCLL